MRQPVKHPSKDILNPYYNFKENTSSGVEQIWNDDVTSGAATQTQVLSSKIAKVTSTEA